MASLTNSILGRRRQRRYVVFSFKGKAVKPKETLWIPENRKWPAGTRPLANIAGFSERLPIYVGSPALEAAGAETIDNPHSAMTRTDLKYLML